MMNNSSTSPAPPSTSSSEPPTPEVTKGEDSTWIILLATALPISLVLSGLIGLFLYKKYFDIRLAKPISRQSSHMTDSDPEFESIPIMEYSTQVDFRNKSGAFNGEFSALNDISSEMNALKSRTIGNDEANKNKNRFIDIMPFDDNVILLDSSSGGSPYSRYINASFINGLSKGAKTYIATQGPKRNTVVDFWNMIVEYGVGIIVCLTNVSEDNRIKCVQYWPEAGENLNFDDLTVSNLKERNNRSSKEVVVRELIVYLDKSEKKAHYVTQIHLTSWPDHGVPETTFPILETSRILRHIQRNLHESFDPKNCPPITVHCSAGVGRTGTFIAVHMICEQILDECVMELDIFATVKTLREQRQKMVQSLSQYILVYEAVRDFINMKYQFTKNDEILSDYQVQQEGYENRGYVE